MLKLNNVTAGYGNANVLVDFSLDVDDNDAVCLYGPSGLGKTTVLMVSAGLLKPFSGKVESTFKRIGFVFQDDRLLPWLSAKDNVGFALSRYFDAKEAQGRAMAWLEKVGLGENADMLPSEMSGGMRRRVNMARALAVEPDLLILDEAFSFLDHAMAMKCAKLIAKWREDCKGTILAISHDLTLTAPLGARNVELTGPPLQIKGTKE